MSLWPLPSSPLPLPSPAPLAASVSAVWSMPGKHHRFRHLDGWSQHSPTLLLSFNLQPNSLLYDSIILVTCFTSGVRDSVWLSIEPVSLGQTFLRLWCLQPVKTLLLYILVMARSDAYLPLLKPILPFCSLYFTPTNLYMDKSTNSRLLASDSWLWITFSVVLLCSIIFSVST